MEVLLSHNKSKIKSILQHLIGNALDKPKLLDNIVSRSVEHDNGFFKIVLQDRDLNGIGYRIHQWKPGASDSNIHNHRWNMLSLILDGGYNATDYRECSIEEGMPYYLYKFESIESGNYKLFPNGTSGLINRDTKYYNKWDSYILNKGDIHKIDRVSDEGAITAVMSWGVSSKAAKVFSKNNILEFHSSQRQLTETEVINCLNDTYTLLNT